MKMELLKDYFKRQYQYQLATVSAERNEVKEQKLKFLQQQNQLWAENEGDYSSEVFSKIEISEVNEKTLRNLLTDIELYLDYSKFIGIQLLVTEKIGEVPIGSYNVSFPYLFKTGNIDLSKVIPLIGPRSSKILVLVYVDLKSLEYLGVASFAEALKQSGEISFLINLLCEKYNKKFLKPEVNLNKITHIAGLNINRLLVLDTFVY